MAFHGISNGMGDLTLLSNAKSRSLCAENPRGEVGRGGSCPLEEGVARQAARDLGLVIGRLRSLYGCNSGIIRLLGRFQRGGIGVGVV